jgi:DNA-binding response OmpR family regulator
MQAAATVLIVEDDPDVREATAEYLATRGFQVHAAQDGGALRRRLAQSLPDLVLLDLNLPGEDGLSLARHLRERHDLPIIMVTGARDVVDRVVGLEAGADDYVAKPFEMRELLARIKSVLRRARHGAAPAGEKAASTSEVRVGECRLDVVSYRLFGASGEELPLTTMEFKLLRALTQHPNQVLSRDRLLSLTRNRERDPFDRSIDIGIARLRRKIEPDPENPRLIRTVRGMGYLYADGAAK